MTKEEAIKYLQQLYPNGGHCWLDEQRIEAINMAVKSLQKETVSEENEENQMWTQELTERNKFWKDFVDYITEYAVGDKLSLILAVHYNEYNRSEGYVKVQKRINEKQEILLDFTISKGDKRTATWQPSDNYACWQTCDMTYDDCRGFLLMPTFKNDEYFCVYYEC